MFGRVARRYDLANHVLSLGVDFWWRSCAARLVESWKAERILDPATGSGDLALAMARRIPNAKIVAADFSPTMIQIARSKGVREAIIADALQLPFEAESFDCVTIAFGLRTSPIAVRRCAKCRAFSSPVDMFRPRFFHSPVDSACALSILFAPILADAGRTADGRKRGV